MRNIKDPGFGYSSKKDVQSIVNKDGSSNIVHRNKKISFQDGYSYLIQISWPKFLSYIFFSYIILINSKLELGEYEIILRGY